MHALSLSVSLVSPSLSVSPSINFSLSKRSSGALLLFLILLCVVFGVSSPTDPQNEAGYSPALSSKDNSVRPQPLKTHSI